MFYIYIGAKNATNKTNKQNANGYNSHAPHENQLESKDWANTRFNVLFGNLPAFMPVSQERLLR